MKTIFLILLLCINCPSFSQNNALVLNGAYVNLNGGTQTNRVQLVINQASTAGIARNSGHIISEGENNIVKWNIGTSVGTYIVPWGYSNTDYIPLKFTISTAGAGTGNFKFSTYKTSTWQNSEYLPTSVTDANVMSTDGSAYMVDRFWSIDANAYTNKPTLTNLTFNYIDAGTSEIITPNTITENNLLAQRWNSTLNSWENNYWVYGIDNTTTNNVTIDTLNPIDLFKWWSLIDKNIIIILPIELVSYTGQCEDGKIKLQWKTASEINSNYFTIETSLDGVNFTQLQVMHGAGNSSTTKTYNVDFFVRDGKVHYYRLKQTDFNGNSNYSSIISVDCVPQEIINIYPNPTNNFFVIDTNTDENIKMDLFDANGRHVFSQSASGKSNIDVTNLSKGIYFVTIKTVDYLINKKIVIQE